MSQTNGAHLEHLDEGEGQVQICMITQEQRPRKHHCSDGQPVTHVAIRREHASRCRALGAV